MSLRDELLSIRAAYGALTPMNVVDASRAEDAPLSRRFEWRDDVAAEKYRRDQAAELIRSVKITFASDAETTTDVRAFVAVRGEDSPSEGYVPTEEVLADPFSARLLLSELKREIRILQAKYGHLAKFRELLLEAAKEKAA